MLLQGPDTAQTDPIEQLSLQDNPRAPGPALQPRPRQRVPGVPTAPRWRCCFPSSLQRQTAGSRRQWLSSAQPHPNQKGAVGGNAAGDLCSPAAGTRWTVRAQLRDYGAVPAHRAGIPAGLAQAELNERHTEDLIKTTRTIHPPGRKRV